MSIISALESLKQKKLCNFKTSCVIMESLASLGYNVQY